MRPVDVLDTLTRLSSLQLAAHLLDKAATVKRGADSLFPLWLQVEFNLARSERDVYFISSSNLGPVDRILADSDRDRLAWMKFQRSKAAYYQQLGLALQSKGDQQQAQVAFEFAQHMANISWQPDRVKEAEVWKALKQRT